MATALAAVAGAQAQAQGSPVPVWIAKAASLALLPAGAAGLDTAALFLEALRRSPAADSGLVPLSAALRKDDAQVRIAPSVQLAPLPRGQARLTLHSRLDIATDGASRIVIDCRTVTSVVLALEGEGGWTEPGLYSLRSAVRRCARDVLLLVSTELNMRQRGFWQPQVDAGRLEAITFSAALPGEGNEFLVLRETDTALFLAATQPAIHGRLRNVRFIVDKPLVEERKRAAAD